jgi:ketosteroid isomerase-like protein
MSSLNIQTVQELYAAFQRRDLNAILAVLSPDVEWSEPENPFNPSGGTRRLRFLRRTNKGTRPRRPVRP